MKRLWIVFGIVLAIVASGTWSLWHLTQVSDRMDAALAELSQAVEERDGARVIGLAERFQQEWERDEHVMMRYIHHDELDVVTGCAARMPALARYADYAELAAEVDRMRHLIRHIRESEMPTPANIF